MKLSILVPAYNEEDSIEAIVRQVVLLRTASLPIPVETECIVVDDCSTDGTADILERLHGKAAEMAGVLGSTINRNSSHIAPQAAGRPPGLSTGRQGVLNAAVPELRVIRHASNQGKGAAIRTALAASTGDYVIIQDADCEYDPADIPRLLEPIVDGKATIVYGARPLNGEGGRWLMDAGNRALSVLTNILYGTRLHDMETCYKLLPTHLLRSFRLECFRFDMEPEITAKVVRSGHGIYEVPISYRPRQTGKKLSVRRDALPAVWALLKFRFWINRSGAQSAVRRLPAGVEAR